MSNKIFQVLFSWTLFFAIHQQLISHGFAGRTLIDVGDDFLPLDQVCEEVVEEGLQRETFSCNVASGKFGFSSITSAAQSETNCYCMIKVGYGPHDFIMCTPTQEFYAAREKRWKAACELRVGDELLAACGATKPILEAYFLRRPLRVYSIEVKDTHTFAVTPQKIIVHNMFCPGIVVTLSIPWGMGAGGTFGGFFGPVTCGVGLVVGGIIGLIYSQCSRKEIPHYQLVFDADRVGKIFSTPQHIPIPTTKQHISYQDVDIVGVALQPQSNSEEVDSESTPGKTIEDLTKKATPGKESKQTKQYISPGNGEDANNDFDNLRLNNVRDKGNGIRVGALPDGRTVVVRPMSSNNSKNEGGFPTLEVQQANNEKTIKIRYTKK